MFLHFLRAVIFTGGLALILGNWPSEDVTFDVAAETDALMYLPDENSDSLLQLVWFLAGAEYQRTEKSSMQVVSGNIHFAPPVTVRISRLSTGPLKIKLMPAPYHPPRVVGRFEHTGSANQIQLEEGATFTLKGVEDRAKRGTPVVLPVGGKLIIGAGALLSGTAPSGVGVRSGSIELLSTRSFKDTSVLATRSVTLRPGDTFRTQDYDGSGIGILVIDERPLINVAYRVRGKEARIERLNGENSTVFSSKSEVWTSDPLLQSVAGVLLVLVSLPFGGMRAFLHKLRREDENVAEESTTHA